MDEGELFAIHDLLFDFRWLYIMYFFSEFDII
jgi:hypothetical protein